MSARGTALVAQDSERRLLEYTIAISIALHVVALSLLHAVTPAVETAATPPNPISARLVEPTPATPPAPPAPPASVTSTAPRIERAAASTSVDLKPKPELQLENQTRTEPPLEQKPPTTVRKETKSRPEPTPRTRLTNTTGANATQTSRPKPGLRASTKPPRSASAASQVARAVPLPTPAASTQGSPVARAAPQPAPPPSAPAIDADLLARYRLQLHAAARGYKRYPRAAIDNEWEGATEVAIVVGANGRIRAMTISKTSGHAVLDRQALDMFRKAKPLVPIPAALRGREFRVTVKAIYSLREPGA